MQDYIALSYLSLKGQKPQRVNGNVRISFKNHVEVHIIRKKSKRRLFLNRVDQHTFLYIMVGFYLNNFNSSFNHLD